MQSTVVTPMYRVEKRVVFEGRFRDTRFYPQHWNGRQYEDILERQHPHGLYTVRSLSAADAQYWLKSKFGVDAEVVDEQLAEPEVLWSTVCPHRVKSDIYSHCGCQA